ncbi:MAG TPA: hypothetical protein VMV18_14720 [bacterium]|nr:hypothetical protein [bacterium]
MRDHALRRIVANALRHEGLEVVEAFDEESTREELRRRAARPIDAVLVDARRYPEAAVEWLAELRASDPTLALIALATRAGDDLVASARSHDAEVFQLPMTARDLRATLERAAHASSWNMATRSEGVAGTTTS